MINKQLRKLKYLCIRLLRIKDKAHSVASGFTVGFLMNFIPSFGFGPFLSTISPKLVRGNPVAGFIGGIAFVWAFPLFFYLNVVVGEALLPISVETKIDIILEELEEGIEEPEEVINASLKIGKAFVVGMLTNILLFGVGIYFFIYYIIKKYRRDLLRIVHKNWNLSK
ncbi:DUF2062 domain-containing protein [Anaerobacillus alkaliphilus]|uniref:DUF2062 domain-containing protein n=1 Tax=Anaerobacillus alkaliphilus TaxID=1548597 RepID=A0A4Q0VMP7_9BACI|nr:DUF2062 domain-containing protein [Anaerobacillus alkaliphilus]RXI96677.1 DUF2062 domain-containing protein [Anaerobacillus alkaliphilus]